MDVYVSEDEEGDTVYSTERILSTDLKKQCGFGKGGNKNYPGIITALQMQTYLVITDFVRRKNKQGEDYGMAVSIMMCPEAIWGERNRYQCLQREPGSVLAETIRPR